MEQPLHGMEVQKKDYCIWLSKCGLQVTITLKFLLLSAINLLLFITFSLEEFTLFNFFSEKVMEALDI